MMKIAPGTFLTPSELDLTPNDLVCIIHFVRPALYL